MRFHDAEFVANDLPIEVWLLEIVGQIDLVKSVETWLRELRDEWCLQATSGFGICPALDKFVTNEARKTRLTELFLASLEALSNGRKVIPSHELEKSGVGGPNSIYTRDLPAKVVIDVGKQFLSLFARYSGCG